MVSCWKSVCLSICTSVHFSFPDGNLSKCSSDRYMIHVYCLAVQAGFYSDVVECWPVMQTARVQSPDAALVIRMFSFGYIRTH